MKKLLLITFSSLCLFCNSHAQNFDVNLLKTINGSYTKNGGIVMKSFTHSINPISLGLPAGILVSGLISKNKTLQFNSYEMMSSALMSGIVTTSLKFAVNRDRPFVTYPNEIEKYTAAGSPSFPSGHTSMAFNTAMSISLIYPKWYFIVPSFLWASGVGYSRMYLGVHYPSDILAGAIIGCGTALGNHFLFKYIKNKKQRNKTEISLL